MAEDRNNIDKDETKVNSENNQSMGNPSNSNQSNDDEYEKICSICRRPESKAGKMIQMGMGMYVCPDCMQRSMDTIMKGDFNYDEMMKLSKDMPGIHFMNMSDLMGDIPQKQKIKKKKEGEKKVPLINLKDIPAPHKIKEKLDEYVIGQEYAKKVISVAVYNLPEQETAFHRTVLHRICGQRNQQDQAAYPQQQDDELRAKVRYSAP